MKNLKRSDVSEEIRFVWDCPNCGYFNETYESPDEVEDYCCDDCKKCFELKD